MESPQITPDDRWVLAKGPLIIVPRSDASAFWKSLLWLKRKLAITDPRIVLEYRQFRPGHYSQQPTSGLFQISAEISNPTATSQIDQFYDWIYQRGITRLAALGITPGIQEEVADGT